MADLTTSLEDLTRFAERDLAQGARAADVVGMLVDNGMPRDDAEPLVARLGGVIRGERRRGWIWIGSGVTLILVGLLPIAAPWGFPSGSGVWYCGALLAGVFAVSRGVRMLG